MSADDSATLTRMAGRLPLFTCKKQVIMLTSPVPRKREAARRSGCPVSISLELLGDRWSLLIIRDLMVRGLRTFKEFQESGEGIASNVLSGRLRRLEAEGIIEAEAEQSDGRRINYRLTERGIDLAPVLLELLIWGARHEKTSAPEAVVDRMEKDREAFLSEVRRRWQNRDATPLLPRFTGTRATRRKSNKRGDR